MHNGKDFIERYKVAVAPINDLIVDYDPDYILALIRKGPRLIELLQLAGLWQNKIPIITERALDYIPFNEMTNKKIVIFDDITISGSTIRNLINYISNGYNLNSDNIRVVSVAIDKDTFRKDAFPSNIAFDHRIGISKNERFTFSNELVKSFTRLNKPYDLDYSIFYTTTNNDSMSSFLSKTLDSDTAFDLTTNYQYKIGYNRYSFVPDKRISNFFISNFKGVYLSPDICKVRAYNNRMTGETSLAPMVTFSMEKNLCNLDNLHFCNSLSQYDYLIEKALDYTSINPEKAIFKLIWYILSYIYGLYFDIRHSRDFELLPFSFPSQMLRFQDLVYIFGPSFSEYIIKFLDEHFEATKDGLIQLHEKYFNSESKDIYLYAKKKTYTPIFDNKRQDLYLSISSYINPNIQSYDDLTSKLSTIFEAMYYKIEINSQNSIRLNGIQGDEYKRLKEGFNLKQLKSILKKERVNFSSIDLSLSLDFLVDAGIQVPIFYESENGIFERAYRYGEETLSGKHYEYVIYRSVKKLFEYMYIKEKSSTFPKIPFEKMGIMIYENIIDSGIKPILKKSLGAHDRLVFIHPPRFLKHGKVFAICDESIYIGYNPQMFIEWCRSIGIVDFNKGANYINYNDKWFKNRMELYNLPDLISDEKISSFEGLVVLLYHIDRRLDEKKKSDYLIALTSCRNHKCFFEAVRAEFNLFFKSHNYTFSEPLQEICRLLKQTPLEINRNVRSALKALKNSNSVAHEIRHKKKLWNKMDEIIEKIENYFLNNEIELSIIYKQNLSWYIEEIKESRTITADYSLKQYERKMMVFGELCIFLSDIFKYLLTIVDVSHEVRIKKDGRLHLVDINRIKRLIKSFNENVDRWNNYIVQETEISFEGISLAKLPIIKRIIFDKGNINYKAATIELVPLIEMAYVILEDIYNNSYSADKFNEDISHLFSEDMSEKHLIKCPWTYVLWYDIIDSTTDKGKKFVHQIKKKLNKTKTNLKDGKFIILGSEYNDERYILIEKRDNVIKYIFELLETAGENQMFIRMGLCYVTDTNSPFYLDEKENEIKENISLVLAKRLGFYRKEVANKEKKGYSSLAITKGCFQDLWNRKFPQKLSMKWETSDHETCWKQLRGVPNYFDIYIWNLKEVEIEMMENFKDTRSILT